MPTQAWSSGDALNTTNLNNRSQSGFQSQTITAAAYTKGTSGVAANDNAVAVNAAIADAVLQGMKYVYVPASMLPYNASLVTFNTSVRMVREGGNPLYWDVEAYGCNTSNADNSVGTNAAIAGAVAAGGGVVFWPNPVVYTYTAGINVLN